MAIPSLSVGGSLGHGNSAIQNPQAWGSIGASQMSQAVMRKPKNVVFFDREGHKPGYRIPVIDKKINELTVKAKRVHHKDGDFVHAYAETVIEVLGDYNPLYSKRPKKLTAALLSRVEMGKCWNNTALIYSGLMYMIPGLPGVRSQRCRISVAGWELLEHWAKKFPSFEKHWLAYMDNKAKEQIYSDCFDLALGHRPASFVAIDKLAPAYQQRLEAREYRKMMKEQKKAKEKLEREQAMNVMQSQYAQQAALKQYQDTLGNQWGVARQALGLYDPNLSPATAPQSGGYVATTLASDVNVVARPKGIIANLLGKAGS